MTTSCRYCLIAISVTLLVLTSSSNGLSWVGYELDTSATVVNDTWDTVSGDGGRWELSGRLMVQERLSPFDLEFHWLATVIENYGDLPFLTPSGESPFRTLDMEKLHQEGDRSALTSEVDRLTLSWTSPNMGITIGRQAITWGEAYYFNINDLFGAFPITETNRLYKQGIDGLTMTGSLGQFSDLALAVVPSSDMADDSADNIAVNLVIPLGTGSLTLAGGRILDDHKAGVGYTTDIGGAKLYGMHLVTNQDMGSRFTETVLGAESQVGPYTHMVAEIYRNGWGTDDTDKYFSLLFTDRYLSGQALTLGRVSGALQISRQVTPVFTVTPALFANLSDNSALARFDGGWFFSDLTTLSGGIFVGLGERPESGVWKSEYGGAPLTVYLEIVHSI